MADIHYYRIVKTVQGAVLGEMTVKGVIFAAIENRNYDDVNRPWIRKGNYRLKMSVKSKNDATLRCNCLRFDHRPIRTFLIHRAWNNNWTTLRGCIAPGNQLADRRRMGTTVTESVEAMNQIFELLGGYKEGKVFSISIENNIPEADLRGPLDKKSWIRSRRRF